MFVVWKNSQNRGEGTSINWQYKHNFGHAQPCVWRAACISLCYQPNGVRVCVSIVCACVWVRSKSVICLNRFPPKYAIVASGIFHCSVWFACDGMRSHAKHTFTFTQATVCIHGKRWHLPCAYELLGVILSIVFLRRLGGGFSVWILYGTPFVRYYFLFLFSNWCDVYKLHSPSEVNHVQNTLCVRLFSSCWFASFEIFWIEFSSQRLKLNQN